MQVEGAQSRHSPHHLGQHAEGHHHLQVGLQRAQLCQEVLVAQLLWLQYGYAVLERTLLDGAGLQYVMMAPDGLVGHGHHAHHLVPAGQQRLQ